MKIKVFSILTAAIFSLMPTVNYSQAPTLGTAAGFVLFSSVGAVTNSGTTYLTKLTGHVGANSGAISGFGNVDGNMYPGGPQSAACAVDLLIAYNQLNATVPTFFPAPLLGNGQILAAGVYSISAPATLNLNLILDAAGNPNAVFIFQISGALSTNANSKVKLINGAKACNVFWKVEGLVSMAPGTFMKGTVIANNAAINMTAGDTLEGRALSTNGAVTVSQILGYTPIGCGSPLLTGPIAPNLATTACYALFSSIGPVSNVGATSAVGDIGTNSGLTTGYSVITTTGTIHPIPDGSTSQCATDLGLVYTYLNALPVDITLLFPAQFGNNLVLTPHTYLMNAATSLTDSVFLNGEGNANAVFVIQIKGALSTSALSKVVLTNGTQSKNVYWMVDGAVSINTGSIFRGTIICNNAAIILATGVTLDGRALTTTGALSTSAVTVTIPSSINITTQPTNQTACIGSSVSFSIAASGLTYQWRKGTVNLINGGNISGATTATLTINPAGLADVASNYNVVITGACASNFTSTNVSLTLSGTSITSQPSNQTACSGSSVSFTTAASGSGLTYQWRKGTTNLINGGNISGATSATLTINPAGISDAAINYNVIVSGGCAPSATSTNVSLTINSTSITSQPSNQTACTGNSVSFTTAATGTGLTYQWRKGIVNLINGGNISGATSATLTINPAIITDAAINYNVIVNGGCAPSATSANVSLVFTGASITSQPSNQSACPGGAVNFTTAASGTGLTYQWRIGTLNLINGGNISGATSATLTVNPVSITDVANNYNVIVSGACAPSATSANVSLSINGANITAQPSNQAACPGNSVSFTISASGTGLTYQWRNGIVNLINGGNISGATTATLTINPISITDVSANYNVVITGACAPNATSTNVSLSIDSPNIVTEPSNQSACPGSSVSFTTGATGGSLSYQWRKGIVNLINGGNISGANTATLTINPISGLDVASNYNVIVTGACSPNDTSIMVSLSTNPTVIALAGSNSSVCVGSSINLTAQSVTAGTYSWTGPNAFSSNIQNPTIANSTTSDKGTYTLSVSSGTCSTASTTINVDVNNCSVAEFFIPEGFSPNGDGINDLFFVRGISNYPDNTFTVFNRWGDRVFDTVNYQNTWDGKITSGLRVGGDELPVGTYFYILDLKDGSPVHKGTIYLNR